MRAADETATAELKSLPEAPARIIAIIFRLLAITFGVVGVLFFLFPNGTVRLINSIGAVLRIFPPAPQSELRFWVSLAVSYMALVTVLAALIQRDPYQHRLLMLVLAAGKFCSSFTCLLFFMFSSATFLYLLNFLVDGSITLVVLGCYLWIGIAEQPSGNAPLVKRGEPILAAVLETLIPSAGAFELGAREKPLAADLWRYFGELHGRGPMGLALLLHGIEYGPLLLGPRRKRFTRLTPAERERYLAGFEHSRLMIRRQLINSLKLITMLHFYDYPDVQRGVGFDGEYLRGKLLAGPNAAYHRARLQ